MPRYPIYIPSKNRAEKGHTAKMFLSDDVPFRVVVEPQDVRLYANEIGSKHVLSLPKNNQGLQFSRNWIKDHSIDNGDVRHWQFDDDNLNMMTMVKGYRVPCDSNVALATLEDFVDRYENVGLASFNDEKFVSTTGAWKKVGLSPFYLNNRCYTVFLVLNSLLFEFHHYNEDTDMTLQVLAAGLCTVLFNMFMMSTKATFSQAGGQTAMYLNDGRLRMSREMERRWPGVVTTKRKFGHPQHHIKGLWKKFDTQLARRKDIDWKGLESGPNDYGLKLKAVKAVRSPELRQLLKEA